MASNPPYDDDWSGESRNLETGEARELSMTPIPPIPRFDAVLATDVCGNKDVVMRQRNDGLFVRYEDHFERIAKLTAEVERLQGCLIDANAALMDWENREAAICPEDVGFEEFIKVLQAENTRLKALLEEIEKYAIYGCGTKQKDRRGNQFAAIVDLASRATRTPQADKEGQ